MEEGMSISQSGNQKYNPNNFGNNFLNNTGNANDIIQQFLMCFVEASAQVAIEIISLASILVQEEELNSYAKILKEVWPTSNDLLGNLNTGASYLKAAAFTTYSFVRLVSPKTTEARIQKVRCDDVLGSVANFVGDEELLEIELSVETSLNSIGIKVPSESLSESPMVQGLWHHFNQLRFLKKGPATLSQNISGFEELLVQNTNQDNNTQTKTCEVWYGTNRELDKNTNDIVFLNQREQNGMVHYGHCIVRFHLTKSLERISLLYVFFWEMIISGELIKLSMQEKRKNFPKQSRKIWP